MAKPTPTIKFKTAAQEIAFKQMMLNNEALYKEQGEIEAAKLRAGVPALSALESQKAKLRQLMAIDDQSARLKKYFNRKATKKKPRY